MDRRELLTGIATLGATVLLPRGRPEAQMTTTRPHRIDVHPPPHAPAVRGRDHRARVATSITSITTPATRVLDDAGARKLSRECNEYSARLVADSKGRFGLFAVMPMPYVDCCGNLIPDVPESIIEWGTTRRARSPASCSAAPPRAART